MFLRYIRQLLRDYMTFQKADIFIITTVKTTDPTRDSSLIPAWKTTTVPLLYIPLPSYITGYGIPAPLMS
jgi:hypothetical protein